MPKYSEILPLWNGYYYHMYLTKVVIISICKTGTQLYVALPGVQKYPVSKFGLVNTKSSFFGNL